ncbi:inner membrane protein YciS [Enterobacter cancerogenus]|uniref:Lipopolysaccharide assembly protein A n=1 Tax=Enterobacter cancerogenus TaxID=69218 RepID=A0A484Z5F8_9ENTR|nr:inner membrane protein YciS [Enterobacter cancerogenus]
MHKNDQQVTFNYLLAQGEYRVSSLLAVLFAAGFFIGWLVCGLFWLKVRVSLARAERKIKRLEHQIAPMTDIPESAGCAGRQGIIEYAGVVVSAFGL